MEEVRGSLDSTDNGTVKNSIRNCLTVFQNDTKMEVIGQHLVAMVFFLLILLLRGGFSDLRSDRWLLSAVIADTKIICQFHSGFFARQSEQSGNKINCIAVRLASEAMETHIHFHTRISVIVEWADCHAVTVDTDAVHLCRLSGGNGLLNCFKYIHCIFLSGNKKGTRHFHKRKRQVPVRVPYSVFCVAEISAPVFAFPVPDST